MCIRDRLFSNTIKAARILGKDAAWAKSLEGTLKRLAGNKIGKEGNLQEWMIDRIPKTDHRHTSHPVSYTHLFRRGGGRPWLLPSIWITCRSIAGNPRFPWRFRACVPTPGITSMNLIRT